MQVSARCSTMQYHTIPYNTMQFHAIPCIIYNCWRSVPLPCGQYMAIFYSSRGTQIQNLLRPAQIWMRQLVLGRPPWQFWIEGGIGPRDASTTPIGPQRTAHLAAVEKTCTPSEIKEVNSCYSLCLKKLFVTNSEKKKQFSNMACPPQGNRDDNFLLSHNNFK